MRGKGKWRWLALAFISLGALPVLGQDATPPVPSGPPTDFTRPLTPEEERARQVQQFDPLAKGDINPSDKSPEALDKAAREAQRRRDQEEKPLPGSIADTERRNALDKAGPRVVGDEDDSEQGTAYTGPAVLSRAYSVYQPLISPDLRWLETFGMNTVVDTGATGTIAPNGQVTFPLLYSTQTTFDLRGSHAWRRQQLGFNFSASDSQYYGNSLEASAYSGRNYILGVNYRQMLSRHLSVSFIGTGIVFSQNYALENPYGSQTDVANINISSSPNVQIFDNGSKQFNTSIDMTYQQTARLSYDAGIGYFGIERNAPGALGTTGRQARGDVNYRLTKKTTVGAYYSWTYYLASQSVSQTWSNTLGLIYSYAFSHSLQLRLRAGISQVETLGLQQVTIDPSIAALLGQTSGIIDAYQKFRTADISAQLVKDFGSHNTASLSYAKGMTPGNGIYQASEQESLGASFSTQLWRQYHVSLSAGRDSLKSVAQTLGTYAGESVGFSVSRSLGHGLAWNFGATARHQSITNTGLAPLHDQYRISTGVSYSPGEGRILPR